MINTPTQDTPLPALPPMTSWKTPKEVATILAVSDRTVRRAIAAGRIAARNVGVGAVPRYLIAPETVATLAKPVTHAAAVSPN